MSTLSQSESTFGRANPHALAAILEASETKRIIAATDIFDISGIKLWARNQPVSAERHPARAGAAPARRAAGARGGLPAAASGGAAAADGRRDLAAAGLRPF